MTLHVQLLGCVHHGSYLCPVIGSILRKNLAANNMTLIGIVGSSSKQLDHCQETRVADLTSESAARDALQGCDAVVHLAASADVHTPLHEVWANNLRIDGNVFSVAADLGVKR